MFLAPLIKLMPRAVLWGYFIFMAIESLPGNQFVHRLRLLVTDPKRRDHTNSGEIGSGGGGAG